MELNEFFMNFLILLLLIVAVLFVLLFTIERRTKELKEDQKEEFSSITYRINQIRSREIENQKMQETLDKLEKENKKLKTKLRNSRKETKKIKEKVNYLIGAIETMVGPEDIE